MTCRLRHTRTALALRRMPEKFSQDFDDFCYDKNIVREMCCYYTKTSLVLRQSDWYDFWFQMLSRRHAIRISHFRASWGTSEDVIYL